MFIEVPDLIDAAQIERLQQIAAKAKFVDGRISNPHNEAKKNLQIDPNDPLHQESAKILAEAIVRNETVQRFALVSRFAPPLICRYGPDMTYGKHADSAFLQMRPAPLFSTHQRRFMR